MLLSPKKWSVLGLLLLSSQAMASTTTVSFSGVSDSSSSTPSFVIGTGLDKITVSAWSDTGGSNDDAIQAAKDVHKYGSGWGIINQDESEGDYPGHSADNKTGTETVRNCTRYRWNGTCRKFENISILNQAETDYDFFMIEFEQDVQLTGANFSWAWGGAGNNQVSVAALNNGNIDGLTWSSVASNAMGSGYAQMQNDSGYYIDGLATTVAQSSKVWLLGAFNSVFGGSASMEGNDGFKLAGISYKVSTGPDSSTIPEPSSIAMLGLALFGLTLNRRKKLL